MKVAEFATEWKSWWEGMQPAWRRGTEGSPLSRDIPSIEEWDIIARGGSNGLFLVVMALSWWFQGFVSTSTEPTDDFWAAVSDVAWVLDTITDTLSSVSVGQKRLRVDEDSASDKPKSKRARSA